MAIVAINSEGMRSLEIRRSSSRSVPLELHKRCSAKSAGRLSSFSELKGMAGSPSAELECPALEVIGKQEARGYIRYIWMHSFRTGRFELYAFLQNFPPAPASSLEKAPETGLMRVA
ncbi:hypothetical protein [Aquabacterium sp.]|uniref:hypothetical protein n=1 Tax=Aquabacterium sp. TaxID=1872578 RepID=UPI003D6D4CD8